MKKLKFIQVDTTPEKILVITVNCPGKVNKVSSALLDEINTLVEEMEKGSDVRGLVIVSGKDDNFVVGADIDEVRAMTSREEIETYISKANGILTRLEKLPVPVVSVIHGNCLGGGVELSLVSDWRIATDSTATVLGLPEIKLGLIPAGGGTQRLPRLVGLRNALPLILQGGNVRPKKARRIGLVDETVPPYGLREVGIRKALSLVGKKKSKIRKKRRRGFVDFLLESNPLGRSVVFSQARKMVMKQTHGLYPAALAAIDSVEYGYRKGVKRGIEADIKRFGDLVLSPQSKSLMNLFFGMTSLKKNPWQAKARGVEKLAVLGAGLMGNGIAAVSLGICDTVLLKDVSLDAAAAGMKAVRKGLEKRAKSGALTPFERDSLYGKMVPCDDYVNFKNTGLVIEAVFEDLALKKKILADVEAATGENTVFASNTSALPIHKIAEGCKRPRNVIGMHYFSPVPVMPLLEIIRTDKTADWALATALDFGIKQGKTCIVVKDGPGFYTTRILAPLLNEAVLLVEEGADMRDIDRAMHLFGYPVGPITLIDEVGIDVGAHVAQDLGREFKARGAAPSSALPVLFSKGYKGKKNKKGFYRYDKPKQKGYRLPDPEVYRLLGDLPRRELPMEEIQHRVSLMMVNEAVHCLQEGIITSPRDGDVGAILGLGFPPFRGGPFRYVDSAGAQTLVDIMKRMRDKGMQRFQPADMLVDMAKRGRKFHRD
jgi:3-hydroxyacyl-CoA dehydrogenase/enoyl-CoA hydratase/3-hydroxybutyryl-CoA epimerase